MRALLTKLCAGRHVIHVPYSPGVSPHWIDRRTGEKFWYVRFFEIATDDDVIASGSVKGMR